MRALKKIPASLALLLALAAPAFAQSNPGWSYGFVPTAAQWNALFASKQDYLGVTSAPCLIAGCVMTGPLITAPSVAGTAGFNLPPGTAPTSPNNGDLWTTGTGIFTQINGSTYQLSTGGASIASATINDLAVYTGTNAIGGLATADNGVLVTNGSGVPSISTTLPSGLVIPGYAQGPGSSTIGCAAPWANTTGTLGNNCAISLSGNVATILGIQSGSTFPVSATFLPGNTPADFWLNQVGTAASSTLPEIGAQFAINSNVGLANASTAYKVALTSTVIGGTNSANIYAYNGVLTGYFGSGGYLGTGIEADVNNLGANAHTLGGGTASYGFTAAMAGTYDNTAGFWSTSIVSAGWYYGFAGNGSKQADFYSGSASAYGLVLGGAYTTGQINGNGFAVNLAGDVLAPAYFMSGTSSGITILVGENTGGSNYVLTLPNITDTLVTLTATQTLTNKTITFASNTLTGVAPLNSPNFTGIVNVPAGSSSAPSLSIGNSTTGFYSVSTTGLGFAVNGATVFDAGITASGYLSVNLAMYLMGNAMIGVGSVSNANGTGYELVSAVASATVPTLVPNQADLKAGIGADTSGDVSIIADNAGTATEVERHTGTATAINTATITFPNITTDTAVTDATLCGASTGRRVYYGSGTLGICLGTSSFAAAKNDINTISNGLEQISVLRPVNYFYKNGFGDNGAREQYGFIAEEYAQTLPNLSRFDSAGNPTGIDMYGLVPVIVSSVKEIIDSCRVAANDNFCIQLLKRVN